MEEIWKDVAGFEGRYRVSTLGRVYSIKAKRILKTCVSNKGYELVCLRNDDNYRKQYTVHRLVDSSYPTDISYFTETEDDYYGGGI